MQRVGLVPLNLSYIRFSRFNTVTIAFIRHRIYCFWYYIQNICRTFLLSFIRFFPLAFSHPSSTGGVFNWSSLQPWTHLDFAGKLNILFSPYIGIFFFFFEISRISNCGSHFKFSVIIKLVHGFEWTKIRLLLALI